MYHHRSRQQDDLDEDAVNAWSTCEPGEPEAAAVAGSEDTRLSDGCLPVGRAEAASAAKKAQHLGEALVIAACHSWPLRHFHADLMCGARPVPEQEPHGRRTVYVGAPCGLFTSAVRYDPGISH